MRTTAAISATAMPDQAMAVAQDLSLAEDEWFVSGQQRLAEELAKQRNINTALNIILMISDGNGGGANCASRLFASQQDQSRHYRCEPERESERLYHASGQYPCLDHRNRDRHGQGNRHRLVRPQHTRQSGLGLCQNSGP